MPRSAGPRGRCRAVLSPDSCRRGTDPCLLSCSQLDLYYFGFCLTSLWDPVDACLPISASGRCWPSNPPLRGAAPRCLSPGRHGARVIAHSPLSSSPGMLECHVGILGSRSPVVGRVPRLAEVGGLGQGAPSVGARHPARVCKVQPEPCGLYLAVFCVAVVASRCRILLFPAGKT